MTATATVTYTEVGGFPSGSVVDHVFSQLINNSTGMSVENQDVAPGTTSVVFSGTYPAGSYLIIAQAMGSAGDASPLAPPVLSTNFDLPGTPVTISLLIPSAVTVVVS